jgi:hypothetical protein
MCKHITDMNGQVMRIVIVSIGSKQYVGFIAYLCGGFHRYLFICCILTIHIYTMYIIKIKSTGIHIRIQWFPTYMRNAVLMM